MDLIYFCGNPSTSHTQLEDKEMASSAQVPKIMFWYHLTLPLGNVAITHISGLV